MALYLIRYVFAHDITAESRDRVVWGFNVEAAVAPTAAAAESALRSAADAALNFLEIFSNSYTLEVIQVYDVVNGGPPVDEALPALVPVTGNGIPGPNEVQIVASRWVLDGLGRPFKKGRWYFGPIAGGAMNGNERPTAAHMTSTLDFCDELHGRFEFEGWTPVVDTKGALHVPETIVQYSVDNAWDTQRRRGIDPTTQQIRDVTV